MNIKKKIHLEQYNLYKFHKNQHVTLEYFPLLVKLSYEVKFQFLLNNLFCPFNFLISPLI